MSTEVEIFAPPVWTRRKTETEAEWAAFQMFRDSHPLDRVSLLPQITTKLGLEEHEVKDMVVRHLWISRVAKYDTWNDANFRQGIHKQRREMGASLVKLSADLIKKSESAIQHLVDTKVHPSYREAVDMARLAIELQRAGFGLAGVAEDADTSSRNESPSEFVQAAIQVNVLVKNQADQANVKPEDILEGEFEEKNGDPAIEAPGEVS